MIGAIIVTILFLIICLTVYWMYYSDDTTHHNDETENNGAIRLPTVLIKLYDNFGFLLYEGYVNMLDQNERDRLENMLRSEHWSTAKVYDMDVNTKRQMSCNTYARSDFETTDI